MKLYIDATNYINTDFPLDISIPLSNTEQNLRAWHVDFPVIEPVRGEGFVGAVAEGGSVNFRNIFFNPHGHGTHTECLGHITKEVYSVNKSLSTYFFRAELITVLPKESVNQKDGTKDFIITKDQINKFLSGKKTEALVIRTLPNMEDKMHLNYTLTNPAYLDIECIEVLNECGVKHLLIDLPSVDRESDEGKLAFHHSFWQVPTNPQFDKTITELVYVNDQIKDGSYILEIQTAPFENDASPSRPILYEISIDS